MWQRKTFHDCASELEVISDDFRSALTNKYGWDTKKCQKILNETSTRGVEVLRILALSIRADQDFGLTESISKKVGALKNDVSEKEIQAVPGSKEKSWMGKADFSPMDLRQSLNKIAHANPNKSGFFADNHAHEVILTGLGQDKKTKWIAVISIIELCKVIKELPDRKTIN